MSFDLRGFIDFLEKEHPEEVIDINFPVDLEYDITAYALEFERQNEYPLLKFNNVTGYSFPVLANLFASRRRIGYGIGLEESQLISGWKDRTTTRLKPILSSEKPVKEVIHQGDDIDLYQYPIPVHFEVDGGRYITGGVVIAEDPDTGVGNLNFTRFQVQGKSQLGASLHSRGDLWDFQQRQQQKDQPLEIAIAIGVHPAISIAGATSLPIDRDELELAGALMDQGVPVVKAETVNLLVPAHAEMVIEGLILPNTYEEEGPMGEYTGYASFRSTRNVVKVTAITHRKDMIYQDVIPGASSEHLNLSKASRIPRTFEAVKKAFPNVVDINYPMSGTHYHCYISIDKKMEGQPKQIMLFLFGLDIYLKHIIVVDSDISVFDEQQVLWALATRFQADRDSFIIPGVTSNLLDPSIKNGVGAKLGMDATQLLDANISSLEFSADVIKRVKEGIDKLRK